MQASSIPSKIQIPFAASGTKNTIPVASQIGITPGAASYTDGFPPLTFTPVASGGVPPYGADFNGILNAITSVQQWQSAGGVFKYDSAFSTAIGGYPAGAVLESTDGVTQWINLADNNSANPDGATPTNWAPLASYGITAITGLTNANVTLTPLQYAKRIITLSGTLTGNIQIIFPALAQEWYVVNNTSGNFTVTCKTAAGTGVVVTQNGGARIYSDLTNIVQTQGSTPAQFDNSQAYSTTAFVQRALGNNSGVVGLSGPTTLTAAQAGAVVFQNAPSSAVTLPLANSVSSGTKITIVGFASGASVLAQGTDNIVTPNNTTIASIAYGTGDIGEFESNGTNWYLVGGSLALKYAGNFAATLATNGSQVLPSGLIFQWGWQNAAATNTDYTWTFPAAFPNTTLIANATPNVSAALGYATITSLLSGAKTSLTWRSSLIGACSLFAIGN